MEAYKRATNIHWGRLDRKLDFSTESQTMRFEASVDKVKRHLMHNFRELEVRVIRGLNGQKTAGNNADDSEPAANDDKIDEENTMKPGNEETQADINRISRNVRSWRNRATANQSRQGNTMNLPIRTTNDESSSSSLAQPSNLPAQHAQAAPATSSSTAAGPQTATEAGSPFALTPTHMLQIKKEMTDSILQQAIAHITPAFRQHNETLEENRKGMQQQMDGQARELRELRELKYKLNLYLKMQNDKETEALVGTNTMAEFARTGKLFTRETDGGPEEVPPQEPETQPQPQPQGWVDYDDEWRDEWRHEDDPSEESEYEELDEQKQQMETYEPTYAPASYYTDGANTGSVPRRFKHPVLARDNGRSNRQENRRTCLPFPLDPLLPAGIATVDALPRRPVGRMGPVNANYPRGNGISAYNHGAPPRRYTFLTETPADIERSAAYRNGTSSFVNDISAPVNRTFTRLNGLPAPINGTSVLPNGSSDPSRINPTYLNYTRAPTNGASQPTTSNTIPNRYTFFQYVPRTNGHFNFDNRTKGSSEESMDGGGSGGGSGNGNGNGNNSAAPASPICSVNSLYHEPANDPPCGCEMEGAEETPAIAPVNGTPTNDTPTNDAATNDAPANGTAVNGTLTNGTPVNGTTTNDALMNDAPTNATPANGSPAIVNGSGFGPVMKSEKARGKERAP
ncbi:hypothetical protein K402DRAFT_397059 [Aulographum hederae CBS 113979]|uniref:Uncharacterized protein n=1 Tax=Aulographum hederae CBS 113979 TaxID=1176131 RepID=A0A6G1GQ10_9PEZI|nr:hypothetical protein K402DRAFT_397059 [Aulographum hederae CBS 113979]